MTDSITPVGTQPAVDPLPAPTTPAAAPVAPAVTDTTTPAVEVRDGKNGSINVDQLNAWIAQEEAAGRSTPEQSAAIRAEAGIDAPTPNPVVDYLKAEGFAPARSDEFQIPKFLEENERFSPELQAADATMRGWLADGLFTREIGSSIARTVASVGEQCANMTDAEREIYARGQVAQLETMWGVEKTAERIRLASGPVRELEAKRPGLVRFLNDSGAGNSATLIANVALHAERLNARHGGK